MTFDLLLRIAVLLAVLAGTVAISAIAVAIIQTIVRDWKDDR